MTIPKPYKHFGKWWYMRSDTRLDSSRPCGPFETEETAYASIDADAAQTEHAMPIPVPLQRTPLGDAVVAAAKAARNPPAEQSDVLTYIDTLLAVSERDVTYTIRAAADLDQGQQWRTPAIEISLAELQAIRAILSLRLR